MSLLRKILIIDDEEAVLASLRVKFRNKYHILTAQTIAEGLNILKKEDVDLVLLDVKLSNENGLDGIKKVKKVHPTVGIAMLSGKRDVSTVVQAIKAGAIDYLTKPINEDHLVEVMERSVTKREDLEKMEARLRDRVETSNGDIVYKGKIMKQLLADVEKLKGHDANVLILGETGTGKELFAKYIHDQEEDKNRPFVAVNCAAIPENLLESELFGHEAGAFTGATRRKIGKFELADGGDIFLDEICSMKLEFQVKLLRVLQEKEFCRLGSNTSIKSNFRIITASNQPLEELANNGKFRIDLFHRLRVIQVSLPSLNKRKEDIPSLVEYFISKYTNGKNKKKVSNEAMERLITYAWPGNVRELSNVIQSLVILTQGDVIDEASFPDWVLGDCLTTVATDEGVFAVSNSMLQSGDFSSLKNYMKDVEKQYIEQALSLCKGDKSKAATALGISRTTFYAKLRDLGLKFQ